MRTYTLVNPPAKTQNFCEIAHASSTFTTISTLSGLKNQKYAESSVRTTPVPLPCSPVDLVQSAVIWKRPRWRQRVPADGTQLPGEAGASQADTDGKVTRNAPSTVRLLRSQSSSVLTPQAPSSWPTTERSARYAGDPELPPPVPPFTSCS